VDVIKSKNFESECVLTSLNYAGILRVKDLDPELKTGLIVFKAVGNIFDAPSDFYSLSSKIVKSDTIRSADRHDKAIHVWTINDLNTMAYFIELGVDNIITDYPAKLVELLQQRADLSDVERLLLKAGNWIKQ
jgi:glycerophosphoryl diester phosphodiesterase